MTIHYHGTPISPRSAMLECGGLHFCVSYAAPNDVKVAHAIGQSVMLDNGAFSFWRSGKTADEHHWAGYYDWAEQFIGCPTTWAVIPDVIDGELSDNNRLIRQWPHGQEFGAPVWHMHEPEYQLWDLVDRGWRRICIGSSGQFATVGSPQWRRRMDIVFNGLDQTYRLDRLWLHMLRGMSLAGDIYPFASLDSTNIAQNFKYRKNGVMVSRNPKAMAQRIDQQQTPMRWNGAVEQRKLFPE